MSQTHPDTIQTTSPSSRPTHISFSPNPPAFASISLSPSSSPSQRENPFERPLLSPALTFYTAPSTPLSSPSPDDPPPDPPASPPPPGVVLLVPPPPTRASPSDPEIPLENDESFPNIDQVPVDPFLDDEGLSSLEKIYLFSRSQATFHRCVSVYYILLDSDLEQGFYYARTPYLPGADFTVRGG
jgi:serine/threonine-protein phosphatase 4 regulatory subunit 1